MRLGARLKTIAGFVPPGARLADIGTDHAKLPIWLVQNGLAASALATDIAAGPCAAARSAVAAAGLADKIKVRQGDGLAALQPGEADTLSIAGMGGAGIIDILSQQPSVWAGVDTVVLQPMADGRLLRGWLCGQGWLLAREELVAEGKKLYEIIAAKRAVSGQAASYTDLQLEAGPLLLAQGHPLLGRHLRQIADKYANICRGIQKGRDAADSAKYQAARAIWAAAEECLRCR